MSFDTDAFHDDAEADRAATERRRREGLERVRAACAQRGFRLDPERLAALEPWVRGEITLDQWYETELRRER